MLFAIALVGCQLHLPPQSSLVSEIDELLRRTYFVFAPPFGVLPIIPGLFAVIPPSASVNSVESSMIDLSMKMHLVVLP